jgi:hypothetical protein
MLRRARVFERVPPAPDKKPIPGGQGRGLTFGSKGKGFDMGHSTTPHEVAIRAATIELSGQAPAFAARFASARNLLLRGGWTAEDVLVRFPGDVVTTRTVCTCQEGRGPVVCLHQIAISILRLAATRSLRRADCEDCGKALTLTNVATIGATVLAVCRPCQYARIAAGRQRQIASDARSVAQATS